LARQASAAFFFYSLFFRRLFLTIWLLLLYSFKESIDLKDLFFKNREKYSFFGDFLVFLGSKKDLNFNYFFSFFSIF
jgi:hypothetical protein